MAKETKSERQLREMNERELYLAEQEATYFPRLMSVLQRAQRQNFDLTVDSENMTFNLLDRYDRYQQTVFLASEYSRNADMVLDDFAREVSYKEEEQLEADRKFYAKQVALNKLTAEERALLDLE